MTDSTDNARGLWVVMDPNWGEPVPLYTTFRASRDEAIDAAITTQERGASLYSGYSDARVPPIKGDWSRLELQGYRCVPFAPSPDVLDDPRVKALVEAAQEVHDDLLRRGLDKNDPETKTPYRQVSIGRSAWWGLCDALARITDTGGRKDG